MMLHATTRKVQFGAKSAAGSSHFSNNPLMILANSVGLEPDPRGVDVTIRPPKLI
jgi:hypothetical protein